MAYPFARAMAGGFFLLALLFYLLKKSERRTHLYIVAAFFALLSVMLIAIMGDFIQALATLASLAILLRKREDFNFQTLTLAGSFVLFFFSSAPVDLLSAWFLADLSLLMGWGDIKSLPGHLFSQGAGILAFIGWVRAGSPLLLFISASARAGFFHWPTSTVRSRSFGFLPIIMSFYLLRNMDFPGGCWAWLIGLWLALGSGFALTKKDGFPQSLWGFTIFLVLFKFWGAGLMVLAFVVAVLKERFEKVWNKVPVFLQTVVRWLRGASEFIEGEGGWLWVGLAILVLLRGLRLGSEEAFQKFLWRELFPEGFGLMSASLYLVITESEAAILFSLLAQYILMAFYKAPPLPGNWLIATRMALGAMVCLFFYLSRWGASWLRPLVGSGVSQKKGSWWLLRLMLGAGGGLLAFIAVSRYTLFSLVPEERLVVFWVIIMGLLGTLSPGSALQRAAGVLTFLNGLELAGFTLKPAIWFAHLIVAMAASFLVAYEKARGG